MTARPLHPELLAAITSPRQLPEALPADPMPMLRSWFDEEVGAARQPNPNAMSLGTIGLNGGPRVRVVLCRGIDTGLGFITFFTNYEGDKGLELSANPAAAATFHWDHSERQVRLEGVIERSPGAESDAYFASRAWESRLSAWASHQSRPIGSRAQLLEQYADAIKTLGLDPATLVGQGATIKIPRPPNWGGFRLWVRRLELWVGGPGRMHDRAVWERVLTPGNNGMSGGVWRSTRLQP